MMNGLPEEFQYNTLTSHPDNPDILYTAPDARPGHTLSPVPIYRSENGGENWLLVSEIDWDDLKDYPSYIRSLQHVGWAISKIRIDASNSDKIYFSNWYGVSISENGGLGWNANGFQGLETNCLENISVFGEDIYYTVADHSPMKSSDKGVSFTSLPSPGLPSSTALTVAESNPDFRIYGARNKGRAAIVEYSNKENRKLKEWEVHFLCPGYKGRPFSKREILCLCGWKIGPGWGAVP